MKITKILLCLAPLAVAVLSRGAETTAEVVQLPAVVVEATRIADPLESMRATLETRTQIAAPSRINVRFANAGRLAVTSESDANTEGKPTFLFKPARNARHVL